MPQKPAANPPAPSAPPAVDRRVAPRMKPQDVPWIREVKPLSGESARLVNISTTGALLETTARLQPGRRSVVVIVNAADETARAEGQVVRTELVSIGRRGELIYRTAMAFTQEFDLTIPSTLGMAAEAGPLFQPELGGPLDGEWAAPGGPRPAEISHLTQAGCYLRTENAPAPGDSVTIRLFFPAVRVLSLTGTVIGVDKHLGCLLRFVDLSSDTRRALRVQLREELAARLERETSDVSQLVTECHVASGSLYANQW